VAEVDVVAGGAERDVADATEAGSVPGALGGLADAEARRRLATQGRNELPEARSVPAWRRFASQLVHFFALMLWVAGVLAFVAGMPQLGVAIFGVILVNGAFAFAQEHRAERAAQHLRDLLPRRATVVRDGRRLDVDAACLVVGDLVVLRAGDRISADLVVHDGEGLSVDASMLTGESDPVSTGKGDSLFAGCFVVRGEGMAVVVAIGAHTRLASIAELTRRGRRPRSPLERELGRVVRTIAAIAVAVGLAFFGLSLLVGGSGKNGFLLAVGVTVALVPEGLLPTVTLSLAVGAQDMARHHALVRRLESVETLGSTTFICTDKTGTLTRNQMSAVEVWTPRGMATITGEGYGPVGQVDVAEDVRPLVVELGRVAARCCEDRAVERNGVWVPDGDPTEAALYALARRCGVDVDGDAVRHPVVRELPFDPERRMMSVVVGFELLAKGAPESILARCRPSDVLSAARTATRTMARRGLRMMAVARRTIGPLHTDVAASDLEQDLTFLGLVGIEDPPREGVDAAIADCRAGGLRIAMLTGDNAETAEAVGHQIGLIPEGGVVLSGPELPEDEAVLGALVDRDDGVVISRVTPEDKLRIARSLQARGHVVAMTGDGVNDGPALQTADIGVAMGAGGTDVAREAADLVLLDDHFATIVEAVAHGRVTFANIRRFLTYHLVCNVAELTPFLVWAISGGRFPLALGVLQILSFDIGAEVVPGLALGTERGQGVSVTQSLQGRHLIDRKLLTRVFGVLGPAESLIEMAAFCAALVAAGWVPGQAFPQGHDLRAASGTAFATVIIAQMGVAFACRSATRWPWQLGWFSNRLLLVGIGMAAVVLLSFLFVDPIARVLGQAPPPPAGWMCALVAGPLLLGVDMVHKMARRRRAARRHEQAAGRGVSVLRRP